MEKFPNLPNQKEYKDLTPFDLVLIQKFPFIEEDFDAINIYGIISKIKDALNKVIANEQIVTENQENVYNSFKDLHDYVNTYFTNLDVQEEINNKLDAMVEDGTLENILENIVKFTKGTLVANLVHRDCSSVVQGVTSQSANNPVRGYIQGITTTPNSIIYAINPGGDYLHKSDMCYLREVSKTTNEIIREELLHIYHANALAYNASTNEIYVTTVQKVNSAGTALESFNRIIVLDYTTWQVKQTITPPQEILDYGEDIMGVSYDNTNGVLALITYTKCFIMTDLQTIKRTIDLSQSLTAPLRNPLNNNKNTAQSGKLQGNKIYISRYFGNGILVFDLNGNLLQNYYELNIDIPLEIGEFEDIAIEEDGTLYITSTQRSFIPNHNFDLYDNTIFKTNVKTNGYKQYYNKHQELKNTHIDYYVDCNTTNKLQIGTEQYPFKHIQQAINSANLSKVDTHIYCTTVGNYEYFITNSNTNIYIDGRNQATFYGAWIDRQTITLFHCLFDLSNDIYLDVTNDIKNILNQYSNVEISDCTFSADTKIDYAIKNFHTKLKVNACIFNNFVNCFYNRNLTETYINILTVTNCDYYYIFEAMNTLYQNSDVLEHINPAGIYPIFFSKSQAIKFTIDSENKKIIFNDYVKKNYLPFKLLYLTAGPVDNNTALGNFIFTFRYTTNNRLYGSCIKNGYIYHVYLELTTNDDGLTYNIYMFKENISTGEKTDVSNTANINFYSMFFVN